MRELRGDWRDIFNGFSVSLDLKKMLLGFIGIALTLIVGVALPFYFANRIDSTILSSLKNSGGCPGNLYFYAWHLLLAAAWWKVLLFVTVVYLLLLSIWSYFGGAIARIAAINLTKDEGLEIGKTLPFAAKKFLAYLMPCIVCIMGLAFFFLWNFLGGLFGRIPYVGEILVMLFLPLAIISGFIMVFIFIGCVFSKHLFFPTIAVEGSDSFDALSRSFSYLYARPWHYIWYQLVASIYGITTIAFVWLFGYFMIIVSLWAGAVGMGDKFSSVAGLLGIGGHFGALNVLLGKMGINMSCHWLPSVGAEVTLPVTFHIASFILAVWLVLVIGFIFAYVVSYYYSSQTIIYLLMRKKVDDIDMKEVWQEEDEALPITSPELPKSEGKTEETKP